MTLGSARHQWEEGVRRVEATAGDARRYRDLTELVDAVQDELRRRIGQTFTLAELAMAYEGTEDWVRDVVVGVTSKGADDAGGEDRGGEPSRAGIRDVALVQDAAFAQYARGATDYRP